MKYALLAMAALMLVGCSNHKPIKTEEYVDLSQFMGKWYVIANIPTFIEKDAYNAVEIYERNPDGTIATTFRFNKGGFDGELVEYNPLGRVIDNESNAIWTMQFIWPIEADYRIVHVEKNYSATIIGRNQRDYVWIMARSQAMPDELYQKFLDIIHEQGYDINEVQRVPHKVEEEKELAWRT